MGFGIAGLMGAAGAGQGLQELLKQRLLEREMALREQTARENAAYRDRELSMRQGEIESDREYRRGVDAEMAKYREAQAVGQAAREMPYGFKLDPQFAPKLKAHGYPVVDQTTVKPELGPEMGQSYAEQSYYGGNQPTPSGTGTPVKVKGLNGRPVFMTPQDAIGKEPWDDPGQAPRPYFTFPTMMGPDGNPIVYRGNARTGELTPTEGPGGNPLQPRLTGAEQTKVNSLAEARQALQVLRQAYSKPGMRESVGPVAGRLNSVKSSLPESMASLPPGFTELVPAIANYRNRVITAITGAQMGEKEADRIRQQTPELWDRGDMFDSKLKMSEQLMEYAYKRWARADQYRANGIDGKPLEQILDSEFGVTQAPAAGKVYLDPNGNPIKR